LVSFVVFAVIALAVAVVCRVIQLRLADSRFPERLRLPAAEAAPAESVSLLQAAPPARGFTGRIDQLFAELVAESGVPFGTETACLMALALGLAVGGSLWLWKSDLLIGALGLIAGNFLVPAYLLLKRVQRRRSMLEQLPDAIDLLVRAVQAGETLEQAIQLLGDELDQPLASEFRRCAHHLDLGLSVDAAMRALTLYRSAKLTHLCSVIVDHRRDGVGCCLRGVE
jgi:tight adherence protein B